MDPGDEPETYISKIHEKDLIPLAILNTHAHLDHIGAVSVLMDEYKIPFYLHEEEEMVLNHYEESCALYGIQHGKKPEVTQWVDGEDPIIISGFDFQVLHTPGHTPGCICISIQGHIFTGDTLFNGSVGRTDLPGGHWPTLVKSLQKIIQFYPEDARIYPGHGPGSTLGYERRQNPFLIQL